MTQEENDGRQNAVGDKIGRQIQSLGSTPQKPISHQELQKLKSAASRLEQMLETAANRDARVLKAAAARLEQFLSDIRAGKDFTTSVKTRRQAEGPAEQSSPADPSDASDAE